MTSATPDHQYPPTCPAQFQSCPVSLQKGRVSQEDSVEEVVQPGSRHDQSFILQKIQPALLGLMDGSVSTLAPIFATAGLTGKPMDAFYVGLAASVGAGISMGLAEALSDDGVVSGRGTPIMRGVITGAATMLGGMLHTLPFLNPDLHTALMLAYVVVLFELVAIAFIKYRYMRSPLAQTVTQVVVGGAVVFGVGVWLGRLGAGG